MESRPVDARKTASSNKLKAPKRMVKGTTFLRSFQLFPKLPIEIRMIDWQFTLEPRPIEIEFSQSRGFYTRVAAPLTLRVNQDSRMAVIPLYPACFGTIIFEARIVFNFDMDTLYISNDIQAQTLHLLAGLRPLELSRLQYMAVASDINEDLDHGGETDIDTILAFSKVVGAMPALRELQVVSNLAWWTEDFNPEGSDPTQLFGSAWPQDFATKHFCEDYISFIDDYDMDLEDFDCECQSIPEIPDAFRIIKCPRLESALGWRPLKK